MRKLWIAVVGALVISVTVAGIASAVNTYEVPKSLIGVKPGAKGSGEVRPAQSVRVHGWRHREPASAVIRRTRHRCEGLRVPKSHRPAPGSRQTGRSRSRGLQQGRRRSADLQLRGAPTIALRISRATSSSPKKIRAATRPSPRPWLRSGVSAAWPSVSIPIRRPARFRCIRRVGPVYDVSSRASPPGVRASRCRHARHPGGLDNAVVEVTTTLNNGMARRGQGKERTVGFTRPSGARRHAHGARTFIDESGANFPYDAEGLILHSRHRLKVGTGRLGRPVVFRRRSRWDVG